MATTKKPTYTPYKAWDVTTQGPMSYKELRRSLQQYGYLGDEEATNNYLESRGIDSSFDMGSNLDYTIDLKILSSQLFTPEQFGVGEDIGSSSYDKPVYTLDELINYLDIRAENLPWYSKAFAGIAKCGVLAGTTFIDGTLGLLYGIGTAINEGRWSGIWDNDITQAMAEINEGAEREIPNYYTRDAQENPMALRNIFSVNTLFDKVVKNFGFMIGAAYSGGIYTKLLSTGFKAIGRAKALRGLSLAAKERLSTEELAKIGQEGAMALDNATSSRYIKGGIGSFMNAVAEGTVEAVNNSNDWVKNEKLKYDLKLQEEFEAIRLEYLDNRGKRLEPTAEGVYVDPAKVIYDLKIAQLLKAKEEAYKLIDLKRRQVGNADLLMNLPILWAGDAYTLGKAYAGGWKAARRTGTAEVKATKRALDEANAALRQGDPSKMRALEKALNTANETGFKGLSLAERELVELGNSAIIGDKTMIAMKAASEPLKEGLEEMNQAVASLAAGYYAQGLIAESVNAIYDSWHNPEAKEKAISKLLALLKGMIELYGDFNKYEEFLIGALTGALGSPTFGKSNNSTDLTWLGRNKMIGFTGGAYVQARDYIRDRDLRNQAIQHVNSRLKDENFTERLKHFISLTAFDDKMRLSALVGDKWEYENAETASIVEDILYFKKVGREDLLLNYVKNIEEFSDEDIERLIDDTLKLSSKFNPDINEDINRKESLQNLLEDLEIQYQEHISPESFNNLEIAQLELPENAQLFEDLFYATKETLENKINYLREEIESLDNKINSFNDYVPSSPYFKEGSTLVMSSEEVRLDLKKRILHFSDIMETIDKASSEIDNATSGRLSDEQLLTLTWYKVMMKTWADRAGEMSLQLKDFLKVALLDPGMKELLQIDDSKVGDYLKMDLSPELELLYGGRIKATKNNYKTLKSIVDHLELINDYEGKDLILARNKAGLGLAHYLASFKEGRIVPILKGFLLMGGYTKDLIEPIESLITDMVKLDKSYRKFNELLNEYLSNPSKIDELLDKIDKSLIENIKDKKSKKIAENIPWESDSKTIMEAINANMSAINELGGIDAFLNNLPKELLDLVKRGKRNLNLENTGKTVWNKNKKKDNPLTELADEIVSSMITEAINLEEKSASEALQEAYEALTEEDFSTTDMTDEEASAAISDIMELIAASIQEIGESIEEEKRAAELLEKADSEQTRREEEEVANVLETSGEENAPNGAEINKEDEEASSVSEDEETDLTEEGVQEGYSKRVELLSEVPQWNPNKNKGLNKDKNKQPRQTPSNKDSLYHLRPQVSEYDLFNYTDLTTYYDNLVTEDIDGLSEGKKSIYPITVKTDLDKEDFKKYIKTVHEFLTKNGAFAFVNDPKGLALDILNGKDEIFFEYDEDLSKESGTAIVVIKKKTNYGGVQDSVLILGTLRTKWEFDIYNLDDSNNSAIKKEKELFDSIIKNHKEGINSEYKGTIQEVLGGLIPTASAESSISSTFINEAPYFAISKNGELTTGNDALDEKILYSAAALSSNPSTNYSEGGRAFALILSNKGYLPALIYGRPLNSILAEDSNWYKDNLLKAVKGILNGKGDTNNLWKEFFSWFPVKKVPNGYKADGELKTIEFLRISFIAPIIDENTGRTKGSKHSLDAVAGGRMVLSYNDANGDPKLVYINLTKDPNNIEIALSDLNKFLNALIETAYIYNVSANIDITKCNDASYRLEIAKYMYSNLARGERGTRSINDWFTFSIGNLPTVKPKIINEEGPAKGAPVKTVLLDGNTFEVYAGGEVVLVSTNNDIKIAITDPEYKQKILDAASKASQTTTSNITPFTALITPGYGHSHLMVNLGLGAGKGTLHGVNRNPITFEEEDDFDESEKGYDPEVDNFLTSKTPKEALTTEHQLNRSIEIIKQLFPLLSETGRIAVVEGLIDSVDKDGNPIKAYGTFKNGILTISKLSPVGTTFHEAFHYVTKMLLTEELYDRLLKAAEKKYNLTDFLELEEKLAEDFRHFMNGKTQLTDHPTKDTIVNDGIIKRFFRHLKHIIQTLGSKVNYVDKVFYDIYNNKLKGVQEEKNKSSRGTYNQLLKNQKELNEIKAKALADGTFMKAPNGKLSNLNEHQWLQVRTKAFKDWFGDWEKDPTNASKVVDINGEPLVVYHGSKEQFNTFDISKFGQTDFGSMGKGFYFTNNKAFAEKYGDTVGVFLNIKNPISSDNQLNAFMVGSKTVEDVYNRMDKMVDQKLADKSQVDELKAEVTQEKVDAISNNDGVIEDLSHKSAEIVAINPNQIKSATDNIGTFSQENNNIYNMLASTTRTNSDDRFKERLNMYYHEKYLYDNLDLETKEYLEQRNCSLEDFDSLSILLKEVFLHCL